jgi:translation initiation factor IF-1
MPRNTVGGSGHRKRKNHVHFQQTDFKDLLCDQSDHTAYGRVVRPLGSRRYEVQCMLVTAEDDKPRLVARQCRLKKGVRVPSSGASGKGSSLPTGSYVLIQFYPFNTDQAQIVYRYNPEELQRLKKHESWNLPAETATATEQEVVTFDEDYEEAPVDSADEALLDKDRPSEDEDEDEV